MKVEIALDARSVGVLGDDPGLILWKCNWEAIPSEGSKIHFYYPDTGSDDSRWWEGTAHDIVWELGDGMADVTLEIINPVDITEDRDDDTTADTAPTPEHDAPQE